VCRNLCGGRHSESACYFQIRTLPDSAFFLLSLATSAEINGFVPGAFG
jgi:hypothetical protein